MYLAKHNVYHCVLNGSMQQYVPILKYFARDIRLISFCYFVSECNIVDLNLELDYASNKVEFMIWLDTPYFEFNPFVDASNNDNFNNDNTGETFQVVDLANVELKKKNMKLWSQMFLYIPLNFTRTWLPKKAIMF